MLAGSVKAIALGVALAACAPTSPGASEQPRSHDFAACATAADRAMCLLKLLAEDEVFTPRTWSELAAYPATLREIEGAKPRRSSSFGAALARPLFAAEEAAIIALKADQAGRPAKEALKSLAHFGAGLRSQTIGQIRLNGGAELRCVYYDAIWRLYSRSEAQLVDGALSAAIGGRKPSEAFVREMLLAWEQDASAADRDSDVAGWRVSRSLADAYLTLNDVDGVRRVARRTPEIAPDYEAILAGRAGDWSRAAGIFRQKWAMQEGSGGAELDAGLLSILAQAAANGGGAAVLAYADAAIAKHSAATDLHMSALGAMPRDELAQLAARLELHALSGSGQDGAATAAGSWAVAALVNLGEVKRANAIFEHRLRDAPPLHSTPQPQPEWAFVGMGSLLDRSADVAQVTDLSSVLFLEKKAGRGMERLPRILQGRWERWGVDWQLQECLSGLGKAPNLKDAQICMDELDKLFPELPPLREHELRNPASLDTSQTFKVMNARIGYVAAAAEADRFDLADAAFLRWSREVLALPNASQSFGFMSVKQQLRYFAVADLRRQGRLR